MADERLDGLERLAKMRDSGALSAPEFENEKRRILREDDAAVIRARGRRHFLLVPGLLVLALAVTAALWFIPRSGNAAPEAPATAPSQQANVSPVAAPVESPPAPAPAAAPARKEAAPPPAAESWVGVYEGSFEGDASGTVTIADRGNERVSVAIGIGAPGCAGSIEFTAGAPRSNILSHRFPRDDSGNQCRLTLRKRGNSLTVDEESCLYHHGFACSFQGQARRR